ncbi:MAG: phosphoribosylaminoimidazolesuccinocarboxamide synthase, partial [Candidatus Omnitrophica bacterium]|nr:phosphoribosylaminoimidazolesuccinocarboxamide synthase [Candidatus Omnitrophota bacterium]
MEAYKDTGLPFKKIYSGKVRELYAIEDEVWLMVATDRVSAFDFILPTPVPGKGCVLNQLSLFWFRYFGGIIEHHVIEGRFDHFPKSIRTFSCLRGRSVLIRPVKKLPIECVVRGYLAGSGWKEYQETGAVCGIKLPQGLRLSDRLTYPIFTPATKE